MMRKVTPVLTWLAIALLMGAAGSYFIKLNFWVSFLIAGIALIINGLVIEWEDHNGF